MAEVLRPIYLHVNYFGRRCALPNDVHQQEEGEGMPLLNVSHVVIHPGFSYLEETIHELLGGMKDVKVTMERRRGERRKVSEPVPLDRRRTLPDRRNGLEKMVSVVINIPVRENRTGIETTG